MDPPAYGVQSSDKWSIAEAKMTQPLIGITTYRSASTSPAIPTIGSPESYLQAVRAAGGIPVLIPVVLSNDELDELLARLDGVLFPGGGDIDPALFQGQPHSEVYGIDADRDRIELHLTRRVVAVQKPFFGICRGIQVINVAMGGSLYTHIADQYRGALRHDWYPKFPREYLAHLVRVEAGSHLATVLGQTAIETNSLHHQGVALVAPGFKPVAWAPDGLIEAIELPDHPFGLGIQWHPENMQAYSEMRALFQEFIRAAETYHQK
jgi:putative glutamine amidotransferase